MQNKWENLFCIIQKLKIKGDIHVDDDCGRIFLHFHPNRYFFYRTFLLTHKHNCSPTKASGGMFSNVTGKVSGWLPSNLPSVSMPTVSMPTVSMPSMPAMPQIPGLRKTQTTDEAGAAEAAPEAAVEAQPSQVEKDDDDRSR